MMQGGFAVAVGTNRRARTVSRGCQADQPDVFELAVVVEESIPGGASVVMSYGAIALNGATAPTLVATYTISVAQSTVLWPPGSAFVAGKPVSFRIVARDQLGAELTCSDVIAPTLTASLGGQSVPVSCNAVTDAHWFQVSFTPTTAGLHSLSTCMLNARVCACNIVIGAQRYSPLCRHHPPTGTGLELHVQLGGAMELPGSPIEYDVVPGALASCSSVSLESPSVALWDTARMRAQCGDVHGNTIRCAEYPMYAGAFRVASAGLVMSDVTTGCRAGTAGVSEYEVTFVTRSIGSFSIDLWYGLLLVALGPRVHAMKVWWSRGGGVGGGGGRHPL